MNPEDEFTKAMIDHAATRLLGVVQPVIDQASRAVAREAIQYRAIVMELSVHVHERLDAVERRLAELEQRHPMSKRKPSKRRPRPRSTFLDRLVTKEDQS
jgi:hypothetical protein